jgi:hypothetical protein
MKNINCIALSAVDTSSQNGGAIDANQLICASFQAVFADITAVGTVKVQASNDINTTGYNSNNFSPTNWSDISGATVAVSAGGVVLIPKFDLSYQWIRAVYTRTSGGSTTVVVNMNALSI